MGTDASGPDRLADLHRAMPLLAQAVDNLPDDCRDLAGNALLNIALAGFDA